MTTSCLYGVRTIAALLVAITATACTGQQEASRSQAPPASATAPSAAPAPAAATQPAADAPIPDTASPYDALPEAVRSIVDKPFTGDFDAMVKRRAIRVAVTFNRTHYFIDRGQERGITYEALKAFENDLNTDLKTGNLKVHVVIVPMSRDQLAPALAGGKVDMVAAMVTVRPELEKLAAFSEPTRTNVEPGGGHRPGRAGDRHGRRSGRAGGVRPQGERLLRNPDRPQRAAEGARQACHRHQRGPRRARRR